MNAGSGQGGCGSVNPHEILWFGLGDFGGLRLPVIAFLDAQGCLHVRILTP